MPLSSLDASLCSFPEEIWATAFHELVDRDRIQEPITTSQRIAERKCLWLNMPMK
jgi:hypothetical protein